MKSWSTILIVFLICTVGVRAAEPLYVNSIVSTDFDFILDNDPNVLESIRFVEFSRQEMPDRRTDALFAKAYIFNCSFSDSTTVQIWAHEDFRSQAAVEVYVNLLANAIGQQPHFNRVDLDHVVLHKGNAGAYAEEEGKFFVIYSDNMDVRIRNHDLQETVFHECAHVAFEEQYAKASGWVQAQQADTGFITDYAASNPTKEDISESAIFAFVLLNHPGRLPAAVEAAVQKQIPNRIQYFGTLDGFVIKARNEAF